MIMPSEKGGGDKRMHLRCCSFRWLCGGIEAIHAALPNAACPGLHRKPLDAAIGQLLAPYRLGGCQGASKQNNNVLFAHYDGHVVGHRNVVVLYRTHRPMEEVQGFHISH